MGMEATSFSEQTPAARRDYFTGFNSGVWRREGIIDAATILVGGPPGKALARKAIPAHIRSLCGAYTEESIRHLAAIMGQREDSAAARVQAANILLDRGWGKPPQAHTGEDGKNISVTIRQIVERGDDD